MIIQQTPLIIGSLLFLAISIAESAAATSTNVALGKPTAQSSHLISYLGFPHSSSEAVDGNTNGDVFGNGSVTHTYLQNNPWWYVDLTARYTINRINVYNRQDCCPDRLSGFKVIIWDGSIQVWSYTHSG